MRVLGRHHGHGWKSLEEKRLKNERRQWIGGQEVGLKEIMIYLPRTMGTAGKQQWRDL